MTESRLARAAERARATLHHAGQGRVRAYGTASAEIVAGQDSLIHALGARMGGAGPADPIPCPSPITSSAPPRGPGSSPVAEPVHPVTRTFDDGVVPAIAGDPSAPAPDATLLPGVPAQAAAPPVLPSIADRYQTYERLGAGANGRVYRAVDRITGDEVAVKMVPAPTTRELDRIRAEVTALRWLRLPGIALMHDDGLEGDEYFVVMDLVAGAPFLGTRRRTWEDIGPAVLTFLETLARVHLAGVVHRDLKPANVLVDRAGQPVIVDFGLARGAALSQDWNRAGTPRYVAPEQALGEACGPQADLYAVGIMLFEALSGGCLPQRARAAKEMLLERVKGSPRSLAEVEPTVPPHVAAVVDRMVARQPDDRPASALEVMAALGGRPPVALDQTLSRVLDGRAQVSARRLRLLFAGPDLFLHLRDDAADVLWQRTGGHGELVAEEVAAWVQAGLCTWEGPVLRIDRVAIERLRTGVPLAVAVPPPPTLSLDALKLIDIARRAWPDTDAAVLAAVSGLQPGIVQRATRELVRAGLAWPLDDGRLGLRPVARPALDPHERAAQAEIAAALPDDSQARLRHVLASGAPPEQVLLVAHRVVARLYQEGQHPVAMALLERTLPLARRGPGMPEHEEALLVAWAKLALAQESPAALERALYELGRATCRTALVERVEELLFAERVRFTDEPERCRTLLGKLEVFEDEQLDIYRVGLTYAAASMRSRDEGGRVLASLAGWAEGCPLYRAKLTKWRGLQAYREGRYLEAAALQRAAAELAPNEEQKLTALVNAAFALLDGGELDASAEAAEEARVLAFRLRHPIIEARSVCVGRQVDYRSRRLIEPRPELVDAAARIDSRIAAQFCVAEAGFALRSGRPQIAIQISGIGAESFRRGGYFAAAAVLMDAVGVAAGRTGAKERAGLLAAEAIGLAADDFALQILGLVRIATGDRYVSRTTVQALVARAKIEDLDKIIDILTATEAIEGALEPWVPTTSSEPTPQRTED